MTVPEMLPILSSEPPRGTRMALDDTFHFRCGKELDCFGKCCRDVSIFLTPYDVLRMKRALGISSTDFLSRYALVMESHENHFPVVLLRMNEPAKQCPFLSEAGCSIYEDRPWACRMYPLAFAEPKPASEPPVGFHFLIQEDLCHGHGAGEACTVADWLNSQGLEHYEMMEASFKRLMLDDIWQKGSLTPEKIAMYFMACYDLDCFRRFVFDTTFLERFELDECRVEALAEDDEELLEFAMEWLAFVLSGARTMKLRKGATAQPLAGVAQDARV